MSFEDFREKFLQQMSDYEKAVGRRIKSARQENRPDLTSHEAAAREFGHISSKQWGRWERGESLPRASNFNRIAEILQVDPVELRGDPPAIAEDALVDQLDRMESKLDYLLQQVGGVDPADFTEVITRGFEDPGRDQMPASDEPAADTEQRSGAKPATPAARSPRTRRSA